MSVDLIARAMASSGGSSGGDAGDISYDQSESYEEGTVGRGLHDTYYLAKDINGGMLAGMNARLILNDDHTVSWESL